MNYKTKYGKSEYDYDDDGSCVVITVNGKEWGSPQGDRFFRALLKDIQDLKEENKMLQGRVDTYAGKYIETLISNIELMDDYMPEWRYEAKDTIKELVKLLNQKRKTR
ncbi:hypothetical protein ACI3ER_11855 [Bacillus sp. Wb]